MKAEPEAPAGLAQEQPGRRRLDSLTRARFFAALGVVLFHACIEFRARSSWYGHLSEFGFVGVSFFFVLSGFVLTWSARPREKPSLFYWHRFARIWPIYALTWLAAVLYAAVGHGVVLWKPVLLGFALLQAWVPSYAMSYNYPAWSLSVEAFFYLLFPLLIPLVRRLSASRAMLVVGAGYAWTVAGDVVARIVGTSRTIETITYAFPPYRLGEFVAGMGLAVAIGKGWRPRVPVAVPLAFIGGLAGVNGFWSARGHAIDRDLLSLLAIPAACALVAALARNDLEAPRTGSALLLRLGEASYALYIVHALVIFAWGALRLPTNSGYLLVYVPVSIVVAVLLHRWVERPVERWLRHRGPGLARAAQAPVDRSTTTARSSAT